MGVSAARGGPLSLIPAGSMSLLHSGAYKVLESTGPHRTLFLANCEPSPPHLRDMMTRTARQITTRSDRLGLSWHVSEIERLASMSQPPSYFESLAVVYGTISHFENHESELEFAPDPPNDSAVIQKVCDKVRKQPNNQWNNLTGSSLAGYSQYHFSRTFRQVMGVGFHEYVERIRLGSALKSWLSGSESFETVAHQVGFASTGAFRDALKTYIGFTPNELKALSATQAYVHEATRRRYS